MSRKMALPIALVFVAACARTCFAQAEQGTITGVVVDASGASIPKAKVTALNQATGATATAETTDEGYYRLPYLLAGRYRVSIEKVGFTLNRISDVPVQVGQNATVDVT